MPVYQRQPYMTIEEYLELDRKSIDVRYEYLDGQLTMMSGGTLDHATIAANIVGIFRNHLRGSGCRTYNSDARVRLAEKRYVYPDITISCDENDRGQVDIIQSPRVVVEVLSPSTEARDRGRKALSYRACPTIQEYMLVSAEIPVVEIFRRHKSDLWILDTFQFDGTIQLTSLDLNFPVRDIYEDIVFPVDENTTL